MKQRENFNNQILVLIKIGLSNDTMKVFMGKSSYSFPEYHALYFIAVS